MDVGKAKMETQSFKYKTPVLFSEEVVEANDILNEKVNDSLIITDFQCATSEERMSLERPNDYRMWIKKGLALEKQMLYVDAIETYSEGLVCNPFCDTLYECRGHIYITVGRYKEAIADSTLCVRINPINWYGWYHIGLGYYFLGEFSKAVEAFGKCLEFSFAQNKHNSAAVDWMYICLKHMNKNDEAIHILDKIDEDTPEDAGALYKTRVLIYKGLRNPCKVLEEIPQDSNYCFVYAAIGYGVAMNYYFSGNKKEAKIIFQKILSEEKCWNTFGYLASKREMERLF